ncbi:MAG: hypothetical protein COB54_04240 [Alphaproteobacteria bacterium]|nr:MAG: hypothetical protein COB54_04240 [Alphaproteobacteria bacterium]
MTKNTTIKAISLATVIAVTTAFSSTAFAHDLSDADQNVAAASHQNSISKNKARNLVKSLLKRDYSNYGYKTNKARKIGDNWVVTIKDRTKTIAKASVDTKTGNIHVQSN